MAQAATDQALKPNVSIEDIGPARKCLTIEVPADQIAGKIEENYGQLSSDAIIPGFRKGHAPRRLIERRFGDSVKDDVRAQIVSEAYTAAIEAQKLDVIGEPDVKDHEDIELPEDGALTFKVEVEITPEVDLPDFTKIEIEKQIAEVTDEDVKGELDQLCERHGAITSAEDGKVKEKDYVQGNVHIYAGEKPADDAEPIAHHHDTYVLVNGKELDYKGHIAGILVDDLGKTLAGKKVGDEVSVSLTGPSSHEDEAIRDNPITIKFNIAKIERVEPVKSQALPQLLGFDDEDAIKEQIRQSLQGRREREQQSAMHEQVSKYLEENVKLDLPEAMTSRQAERVLQRRAMELAYQGMTEQEIEQQIAEARATSEEEAKRQLKLFFIIDKAAKQMEVEVSENEITQRITMQAMQQGRRPEKLRQQMQRAGELEHLYMSLREQKTLDMIVEKATVKEAAPAKPKKKAADKEDKKDDADETSESAAKPKSTKKKSTKKKSTKKKTDDGD